jgi:Tol biopolymer transport system component
MNMNKTIASIVIIFLLLSLPTIADTNNESNVEEIISITDILRSHTEGEPASFTVQETIWSPDGSKLLIRYTDSPSQSEQIDDLYVVNADGTELNKIASSKPIKSEGACIAYPMWSPTGDKIAFHLSQFRGGLLAVVNPDGTGLNAIGTGLSDMESILSSVPDFGWQRWLKWSPDEAKMAFEWGKDKRTYIYVADADGSNPVKLYPDAPNSGPVWSHDSRKIAFRTKRSLMSVNVDGTGLTYLSNGTDGTKYGIKYSRYSWSPDDSKLVYLASTKEVDGEEQFGIFVVNADGTKRTEIMTGAYFENPRWSPDGSKILFALEVGGGAHERYIVDADGRNLILLSEGDVASASWSPDGSKILFALEVGEDHELYTVDADGRNLILLSKGHISGASWSPDGSKIAFMKDHSLYTMNPDNTGKMMLSAVWRYSWSPSGDKIAFSSVVDPKTGKEVSLDAVYQNPDSYEASIFMSNPDGTKCVRLMRGGYSTIKSWSPDGSRLLVISLDEKMMRPDNAAIIKLSNVTPVFIKPTPKPLETVSAHPTMGETPEEIDTAVTETTTPATDPVKTPGFTAISSVIGLIILALYLSKHRRSV